MKTNAAIEKVAPMLTRVMIKKIESLQADWKKPWVTCAGRGNLPRNIRGTNYCGINILTLAFRCEEKGFKTPVFMTFNQAKAEGVTVKKGERAFPVYFFSKYVVDKVSGKSIKYEEYLSLNREEQAKYKVIPNFRYYNVFNLDQTDFAEKFPDRYAKLQKEGKPLDLSDGFSHAEMDEMIAAEKWYCPIRVKFSDNAYYSPWSDEIVCPEKRQFPEGMEFYTTLLHEMAHSTGHASRLNRLGGHSFGSPEYAREELIAELTAALCGVLVGVTATLQEENAAYLKGWLKKLREEPKYLMDILKEVTRATYMITGRVGIQNVPAEETEETEAA